MRWLRILQTSAPLPEARRYARLSRKITRGFIMRMRTIAVMFIALFVGGCAWVGGGKNKSAENFDLATTQRTHWQQLAEQDNAEAEYQLGLSYCYGYVSSRTQTTARVLLCKAAMQGHGGAHFLLGELFGFRMMFLPMSLPCYTDYS